jgi:sugar phosphate isomerase/epimerase
MIISRRRFLITASGAVAAPVVAQTETGSQKQRISVFTKPFNSLSFDELADRVAEIGFDGIEATVRSGGNVESQEVEEKLPMLSEALSKRGLEVTIMTSDINDPDDPITAKVLRTAATLGIERYRMKYLKYDLSRSVNDQIKEWKPRLQDLAAINHDFGVRGLYQNHAGSGTFGSPIWDIYRALEGISPADLAVAYDIRHATVEGGQSWPTTFNMIRPLIDTVYVKDFDWKGNRPANVPLGKGRVEKRFFEMLRDTNFKGPISLHEEYLDHRKPDLVPEHLAALKTDLAQLKTWL